MERKKYKIIITKANKQVNFVSSHETLEQAFQKFDKMIEKNHSEVFYPLEYLNNKTDLYEAKFELLLLKLKEDDDNDTVFRDEFGNIFACKTENYLTENNLVRKPCNDEWLVVYKEKWYIEESFWVYGYHPLYDRKNCQFILSSFIDPMINATKDMFMRIVIYHNKLLFDLNNNLNFVICKNVHESKRLYDFISKYAEEKKIKQIIWCGMCQRQSAVYWIDKIQAKTNWDRHKIIRNSTRP